MGERRINFGSDSSDARYRVEDTGTGANFTVVEDLNGNTVVLQYDQTNLVGGVPLDLSGQDLLGTDIVDGANINLSDIAGENISVDGVNDELDSADMGIRESIRSTAYWFNTTFESIDDLDTSTSGGGSVSLSDGGLNLSSGGSSGDDAFARHLLSGTSTDLSQPTTFVIYFNPQNTGDYVRVLYGSGELGPDATRNHIGIKVTGGDLIGQVANGTSQTTTTLISGISTGTAKFIRIEHDPGTATTFYDGSGTQLGEITSGLPDGGDSTLWQGYADNTTGTSAELTINFLRGYSEMI